MLAQVKQEQRERQGTADERDRGREPSRRRSSRSTRRRGSPYYSTARLWDDGVIAPVRHAHRPRPRHLGRAQRAPSRSRASASSACEGGRHETFAILLALSASTVQAGVLKVAELNTLQIRELDRSRTAVILPGGILEEHGPYLPSYADGYANERMASDLAEAIAARPGWTALVFPPIPLGVGGASEIGAQYVFPGSYTVRSSTLRAVFMDLAAELGDQGFKWVFVVHGHGSPSHNRALDEGRRVLPRHVRRADGAPVRAPGGRVVLRRRPAHVHAGAESRGRLHGPRGRGRALGRDVPAARPGARHHQGRPERHTGTSFADLMRFARQPDWPGYFGAPRLANPARGEARVQAAVRIRERFGPEGGGRLRPGRRPPPCGRDAQGPGDRQGDRRTRSPTRRPGRRGSSSGSSRARKP